MGLLGHAILNEGRDPTGMHVLNLKFTHKPAENRECNKTIHMSSMSEQRDLPFATNCCLSSR